MDTDNKTQKIEDIKSKIAELLSDNDITLATAIFVVKGENEPIIYRNGHFYDIAALMNDILEVYRMKAAIELGINNKPKTN